MGKLITKQQAAEMTGLTRQTIQNWIDKGVLKCIVVGKAHFLDSTSIESLSEDLKVVENSRTRLKELKEDYEIKQNEFNDKITELKECLSIFNDDVLSAIRKRFYLTYPSMLSSIGLISAKEKNVLTNILQGYSIDYICKETNFTIPQITKIAKRAINNMSKVRSYIIKCQSNLCQNYKLQKKLNSAHHKIELLKKELNNLPFYRSQSTSMEMLEDDYQLHLLLNTKLEDIKFSKRTQNVFNEYQIKTLRDLVKYNKRDILKLHGFGKTCMYETDDILESLNLYFGMYTDRIEENYDLYMIDLRERCITLAPILNTNLEDTELYQKWYYEDLIINNVVTIGDLASKYSFEIKDIVGLDSVVEDISSFLKKYGLHLSYDVEAVYMEYELMNIQSSIDRKKEEVIKNCFVGIWDIEEIACSAEDKEPEFSRSGNGAYWDISTNKIQIHDELSIFNDHTFDYTISEGVLNLGEIEKYAVTELTKDKLAIRTLGINSSYSIVTFRKRR
jgi:hypothetical protein